MSIDESRTPGARRSPVRPSSASPDSLAAESAARIRGRLDDGYYESPRVLEALARRLLRSGDL